MLLLLPSFRRLQLPAGLPGCAAAPRPVLGREPFSWPPPRTPAPPAATTTAPHAEVPENKRENNAKRGGGENRFQLCRHQTLAASSRGCSLPSRDTARRDAARWGPAPHPISHTLYPIAYIPHPITHIPRVPAPAHSEDGEPEAAAPAESPGDAPRHRELFAQVLSPPPARPRRPRGWQDRAPSVRLSVRPSVCPCVRPSGRPPLAPARQGSHLRCLPPPSSLQQGESHPNPAQRQQK